jgi:hypothetical protein
LGIIKVKNNSGEKKGFFMKRFIWLSVLVIVLAVLLQLAPAAGNAQVLLKEALGPGQEVRSSGGKVVIVSKKVHAVATAPDMVMVPHGQDIKLKIGFFNLGDTPLEVSEKSVLIHSKGKKLKLVSEKNLVKQIKKQYSSSKMDIDDDQEEALAPYVKDKIQKMREELLKKTTIEPKKNYWGVVHVETPDGNKEMTIEATLGDETHKITYNVISLK